MNENFISRLRCPQTHQSLKLEASSVGGIYAHDYLVSEDGQHRYPIRNCIVRFVPESNYADNFGMQWNHFSKTQLDSHSGVPISSDRFWKATGWNPSDMNDKWVLDVGCGAGRFAEVALNTGAHVVALDYSSAVDACWANLKHHKNLHVVQGDIYTLPFAPESFDFVYCLGVLQHTPNVKKAFAALPPMVVKGGYLCADVYWKRLQSILNMKLLLRPMLKRVPQQRLFNFLARAVPIMLPISQFLGRSPVGGKILKRLIPVADYTGVHPLTDSQLNEWALLDTFDWFAPKYDNPQTARQIRKWFDEAGLLEVQVFHGGHLVGRGQK